MTPSGAPRGAARHRTGARQRRRANRGRREWRGGLRLRSRHRGSRRASRLAESEQDSRSLGHHRREHLYPGISWSPDSRWIIGRELRPRLVDVAAGVMVYLPWYGEYPAWRP